MTVFGIKNLRVETRGGRAIVDDVDLTLAAGEILAVVGESGSGKTTAGLAMLGHARSGLRIASAEYYVGGSNPVTTSDLGAIARMRGKTLSYVPQDPATALNPSMRIGDQIAVMLRTHDPAGFNADRVAEMFQLVQLPSDSAFRSRFPHQLSGGQQQRVAIAMGLVCKPLVAVFDEPTTGLDVITQANLLKQIELIRRNTSLAMIYVTHDLSVVAQIADRVAVMYAGRIVEMGSKRDVLKTPRHTYTAGLLAATPDYARPVAVVGPERTGTPVLTAQVTPIRKTMTQLSLKGVDAGYRGGVTVCHQVTFDIAQGECVAVVGQSGSGKSTLSRVISGLHAPSAGTIEFAGKPVAPLSAQRTREQRQKIQMIFQNPRESLNPRHTIADSISRSATVLLGFSKKQAMDRTEELLGLVRLKLDLGARYPDELSGGQLQRAAIARALAAEPSLLICDEVTSALDVSVQASVLELLTELRQRLGLSMLFVTHDLGVVASVAQRVLVFDKGHVVERGETRSVLDNPKEQYTKMLLAAAPSMSKIDLDASAA